MNYEHTQEPRWTAAAYILVAIFTTIIWHETGYEIMTLFWGLVVFGIIYSARSLTVIVSSEYVLIKLGDGIFKKRYQIKDIESVKQVRNHWYYGWGIKYWPPRKMWIYNIEGLDAVELKLKNGAIRRIGTDEPQLLELAIKEAMKKA